MATAMAIMAMSSVPRKTGTAPKAPAPAIWSARIAICGSQRRPKKKSAGGTSAKKAQASQSSDTTMPTVVRIARAEQITMKAESARSTAGAGAEARGEAGAGEVEGEEHRREDDHEEGDVGDGLPAGQPGGGGAHLRARLGEDLAGGDVVDLGDGEREVGRPNSSGEAFGQAPDQSRVEDTALDREPEQRQDEGRDADPDRDVGAMICRQRMHLRTFGRHEAGGADPADQIGDQREDERWSGGDSRDTGRRCRHRTARRAGARPAGSAQSEAASSSCPPRTSARNRARASSGQRDQTALGEIAVGADAVLRDVLVEKFRRGRE